MLIAQDVADDSHDNGGISLILSDRKEHCESLQRILISEHGVLADVLTGALNNGDRADLVQRLRAGKINVLIATGQLIGEGFDLPAIESLFLATPIKFSGRLLQYVGRALRPAPGKTKARIYDFVDANVGVFEAAATSRYWTFKKMPGVEICKN
jgi:superfamily II DNA or RNA helicase